MTKSYKIISIRLETNVHVRGCILLNLLGIHIHYHWNYLILIALWDCEY